MEKRPTYDPGRKGLRWPSGERGWLFIIPLLLVLVVGCATFDKYHVLNTVADWEHKNHLSLQARYDAATPEEQEWLRENVNPYMNVLQQAIIGYRAIDADNDIELAGAIKEITRIAVRVEYDPARLIVALRAKDYGVIEVEVVILKDLIIKKIGLL